MLDNRKRWIYVFDFSLSSFPERAPIVPLKEAAKLLKKLYEDENAYHLTREETVATRISDLSIVDGPSESHLSLLIQYADKNASDPVFAKLETGELRQEPKLKGEGVALSAHMLISLDPIDENGQRYIALLEEVPRITKTQVTPFIRHLLSKAYEGHTYEDPDTKKSGKFRPIVDLDGHPDQTLADALDGKDLAFLTLTGFTKNGELDSGNCLIPVEHSLTFKVKKTDRSPLDVINDVKNRFIKSGKYEDLRVTFRDPSKKSTERRVEKTLKLEKQQDAATALFTRQLEVSLAKDISQCESKLNFELCAKMVELIREIETSIKAKKKTK